MSTWVMSASEWASTAAMRARTPLPLLTVTMMRVSNMTVYRLVHSGDLPAVRFGRSFRIPESAVVAAIQTPIADVG